ncbi:MAG: methyltransferase domain-containing protein [Actinomycetota bacterium]|nr:methyltransferase domain-containing protein [Actinomycetota bacterium]
MSSSPGGLDWDAATYDRVSDPQLGWGLELLDRLPLRGDEVVLDAGCGSGRVTRALLERLPGGRAIAVDASPAMVERARAALGSQARVLRGDLCELTLEEPVDAVFSNAVFHWIPDHARLFSRLRDVLRPGGRLPDLEAAGFVDVECWLEDKPTVVENPREFWPASSPGSRLHRLPGELRGPFVDRVLSRLGEPPTFDYVRLSIAARCAHGGGDGA